MGYCAQKDAQDDVVCDPDIHRQGTRDMYVDQYLCGQKPVHALFRAAFFRMWSDGEVLDIF